MKIEKNSYTTWLLVLMQLCFNCNCLSTIQYSSIVFSLTEELPSGEPVGNVLSASGIADQIEVWERNDLVFKILSKDGLRITSSFSINSRSGEIFTNAMIDREQICETVVTECRLQFDVSVSTSKRFIKLLPITIGIVDTNDNSPMFPKRKINLTISESVSLASYIPIDGAIDRDIGYKGNIRTWHLSCRCERLTLLTKELSTGGFCVVIRPEMFVKSLIYFLHSSEKFELVEETRLDGSSALRLKVVLPLDRELSDSYTFFILASDGPPPLGNTGTLTVNIIVSDVNDNRPVFSHSTYNFSVMETIPPGLVFGKVEAVDADSGDNAELHYRFSSLAPAEITNNFYVQPENGSLSALRDLSYQSVRQFEGVVEVLDKGDPVQLSQANVLINVVDAGNTPPILDLVLVDPAFGDSNTLTLAEDVKSDNLVGSLVASDHDSGLDGIVNCQSEDDHFALRDVEETRSSWDTFHKKFSILVSTMLDREEQQELHVIITCTDSGSPPLTSSLSFTVVVQDVNDNPPMFSQNEYSAIVLENVAGQRLVTVVTATDPDDSSNNVITRYYLGPKSPSHFIIDSLNGRITTQTSFDREVTPGFRFIVFAVDSGNPIQLTGSCAVSVTIGDVNDNVPVLTKSEYYVSENAPAGYTIPIEMHDADSGQNGEVMVKTWRTESNGVVTNRPPVEITTNGSLTLRRKLDREIEEKYLIFVTLHDNGIPPRKSNSTIVLHVVDANDHAPTFLFPSADNSSVEISADLPVGSRVCRLRAEDLDLGTNGHISFSIVNGNGGELFGLSNVTGELFVVRSLLSFPHPSIHLELSARDKGSPSRSSLSYLTVNVRGNGVTKKPRLRSKDGHYAIIAGVIAGFTFIVAVIVIGVIVHLRLFDAHSSTSRGGEIVGLGQTLEIKRLDSDSGTLDKTLSVHSQQWYVRQCNLLDCGQKTEGESNERFHDGNCNAFFGSTQQSGQEWNRKVQVTGTSSGRHLLNSEDEDRLLGVQIRLLTSGQSDREHSSESCVGTIQNQYSPLPFATNCDQLKPENEVRHIMEDHNSDTSGETTTFDSGRGASDDDIVYPVPGKGLLNTMTQQPNLPPIHPLMPPAVVSSSAIAVDSHRRSHFSECSVTSRNFAHYNYNNPKSSHLPNDVNSEYCQRNCAATTPDRIPSATTPDRITSATTSDRITSATTPDRITSARSFSDKASLRVRFSLTNESSHVERSGSQPTNGTQVERALSAQYAQSNEAEDCMLERPKKSHDDKKNGRIKRPLFPPPSLNYIDCYDSTNHQCSAERISEEDVMNNFSTNGNRVFINDGFDLRQKFYRTGVQLSSQKPSAASRWKINGEHNPYKSYGSESYVPQDHDTDDFSTTTSGSYSIDIDDTNDVSFNC